MSEFPHRVGLIQRVMTQYRAAFFESLGTALDGKLSVAAGLPRQNEAINTCVGLNAAKSGELKNIHLFSGSVYLCWQSGLLRWLENWQPDVLIVEANPRYLRTPAAIRWMKNRQRTVIGWGLGAPSHSSTQPLPKLRRNIRRRFIQQFDAIITYSRQGFSEYQELGFNPERIIVAPNAGSPKPTRPLPDRQSEFKNNRPIILFVGRLQSRKRVDHLIQACASLPEHRPHLWIVGDGPVKDSLVCLARNVYPEAKFFGALHGEELTSIFEAADLFILPGTGGLAVQQAMSYGLPIIVAEADGTQTDLVRPQN
ncbi:MAG: glycosyltransferase family 4 protein, partial [Anaerolineaceae bacterium]|nr:glycosyltransferase family 4 protein [Anaerolineaceae bacterium]